MGLFRSPKAPPPPDPYATAAAQSAANKEAVRETALVNQIGTQGPWGRTYYTGKVGSPDRTQVTELNPVAQQAFNSQQDIARQLAGYGQQLAGQVAQGPAQLDFNGLPAAPWEQNLADQAKALEDATYQRSYNMLQPEFDRRRNELDTRLANMGITMGSEAYNAEKQRLADQQNRALTDLALASVGAGRQEQSRLFGLGSAGRQAALSELLLKRTQPMNELSAILQGAPALPAPQPVSPGQYAVQPGNVQGAINTAYQGALQNYQQQQAARNAMMGNLFSLGGTLGAAALF